MTFNIENIKKFLNKNCQIIIIILSFIFIYILFYTDYIIQNSNGDKIIKVETVNTHQLSQSLTQSQQSEQSNLQLEINPYLIKPTDIMNDAKDKHVTFDIKKNQEIVFENTSGRLDIDYNSPHINQLQKISQCSYPMNSSNQLNMRDCTINPAKSCLTKYSPQEWFKKQREAKIELPGFNGDNLAQFKTDDQDEYSQNSRMMRDMVYENVGCYVENKSPTDMTSMTQFQGQTQQKVEKFNGYNYDFVNEPEVLYQNSPFMESPQKRPAYPNDKCRSCTVGFCDGSSCGSELGMYKPEHGAYFY